jgi:hypothetical protein
MTLLVRRRDIAIPALSMREPPAASLLDLLRGNKRRVEMQLTVSTRLIQSYRRGVRAFAARKISGTATARGSFQAPRPYRLAAPVRF